MSHMKQVFRTIAALLLIAGLATPALAQTLTGSISGVIKDEQGAILPGVTVTLTGKQGDRTAVTDASGTYRFPGLEPGAYDVAADLSGFATAVQRAVPISPGRELNIDLVLKVR